MEPCVQGETTATTTINTRGEERKLAARTQKVKTLGNLGKHLSAAHERLATLNNVTVKPVTDNRW